MDGIEEGQRRVVVELSQVDYMGSAGLRALLGPYEELRGKGGKLALAAVHENVEKVLELSKFTEILDAYPDVETAVWALQG
jgi:anti-anti-sigma factor